MEQVTTEFLAAMFGAHLNCDIAVPEVADISEWDGYKLDVVDASNATVTIQHDDFGRTVCLFDECKPILTPLSEITEEDAIELAVMVNSLTEISNKEYLSKVGKFLAKRTYKSFRSNEIDHLRSRGYDCGFRHITSLIDAGLAVKAEAK